MRTRCFAYHCSPHLSLIVPPPPHHHHHCRWRHHHQHHHHHHHHHHKIWGGKDENEMKVLLILPTSVLNCACFKEIRGGRDRNIFFLSFVLRVIQLCSLKKRKLHVVIMCSINLCVQSTGVFNYLVCFINFFAQLFCLNNPNNPLWKAPAGHQRAALSRVCFIYLCDCVFNELECSMSLCVQSTYVFQRCLCTTGPPQ